MQSMLKVEKNQDMDIDKFSHFFFKAGRRQLKSDMIRCYNNLENIKNEDQMKNFVEDLYKKNNTKIDLIIGKIRKYVEHIDPHLWRIIENLMNEKFDSEYFLYPTMLPMSPYGKKHFNLSIMQNVFTGEEVDQFGINKTSVHELSHILFYKKMERLFSAETHEELAKKMGVNIRSMDGLKEIYASIIQNLPKMRKFFPNRVRGNKEYGLITVKYKNHIMRIEDYFIEKYMENEGLYSNRDELDKEMVKLLKKIDKEFSNKLEIYNTVDQRAFIQKGLFNPIMV